MAERGIVNVPAADQLLRLYRGIVKQEAYLASPVLAPWKDLMAATIARLDAAIAPRVKEVGVPAARAAAAAADAEHDRAHRYVYGLASALAYSADAAVSAAAGLVLATLYPDKLAVVNAAWADEVAGGPTFAKKLALPEVSEAFTALSAPAPGIRAAADAVVTAAATLGTALDRVDAALVEDAGKSASELFRVRTEAHSQLSVFAQTVSSVAYRADTPEDKAARLALIGPYLRYLSAGPRPSTPPDAAALPPGEAQA
ncbi:MAG: hypothetical protein EP329_26375 [Deltaproteobacteria bacterium]|nr:MAG: hypothetical protein EP329_26375 [Deltaproteobacteria bacterium]